jgi:hypothetical protein
MLPQSTNLDADKIWTNLEIQRFLRDESWPAFSEYARTHSAGEVAAQISARVRLLVDFEIHRRKIFWVDESLVYFLVKTDLDVTGAELRAPFPTFGLVFTDRLTLSLAKRMLSMDKVSPLAGYLLRVATVYHSEDRRVVLVAFALDALAADPPHLSIHEIPLADNRAISHALDELAPKAHPGTLNSLASESQPLRALLHITINAVLYATGVAPKFRRSASGWVRNASHSTLLRWPSVPKTCISFRIKLKSLMYANFRH